MAIGSSSSPSLATAIISILVVVSLAVLGAFWQLSDPRGDIKDIRANYLTVREHNEFTTRIARDVARIEEENNRQNARMLAAETFQAWEKENAATVAEINKRLDDKVSRSDIEALSRQVEVLFRMMHEHERDDRLLNGAGQKGGSR